MKPSEALARHLQVTAWCGGKRHCGGRIVDLTKLPDLAFEELFPRMRCERCGAPAGLLKVTDAGVVEPVLRLERPSPKPPPS